MANSGLIYGESLILENGGRCTIDKACSLTDTGGLRVLNRVRTGTVLEWNLVSINSIREWSPPIETAIDYARVGVAADAPWTQLADYAERPGLYQVTRQLAFGGDFNVHFRLRLRDAIGNVYTTRPVHVFDDIPSQMQSTYRESIRRWQQRLNRGELRQGVLLKRRRWGSYCATCIDRDGKHRIRTQCPECFDVGFSGGYYQAETCFGVEGNQSQIKEEFTFTEGYSQKGPVSQFLFLDQPQVYPGDVWVDRSNDERWLFGSPMVTKTRIGNVELFRVAPVSRFDLSHVVYDYPVDFA